MVFSKAWISSSDINIYPYNAKIIFSHSYSWIFASIFILNENTYYVISPNAYFLFSSITMNEIRSFSVQYTSVDITYSLYHVPLQMLSSTFTLPRETQQSTWFCHEKATKAIVGWLFFSWLFLCHMSCCQIGSPVWKWYCHLI